ncbi:MAG: HPr family phosphocarrier protein [Lachnospiraceae bacterium]|nr:HPr family phosphocarrier protein [Lachnospiraceae bacterium]
MKTFDYVIQDSVGIHARPAGLLVKAAKEFSSKIYVKKGETASEATKLMSLMKLGVKCGDTVTVEIVGDDEEQAFTAMQTFFEENL